MYLAVFVSHWSMEGVDGEVSKNRHGITGGAKSSQGGKLDGF